MGMTDRQFDAFRAEMLLTLKAALALNPENEILKNCIAHIESQLKRP